MGGRRRGAAGRVVGLLLTACVLLGGCTGSGGGQGAGSVDAGVRQVLARRAAAVLGHDAKGFEATVDPGASRFRAEQQAMFGNLAEVPLAAWSYRLVRTGAFPLPAAAGEEGTVRTAAEVELRYRLRGYDAAPVVSTEYLTLTRRDARWYVAADDEGAAAGKRGDVQIWDEGRVTVVRGAHSLVLGLGPAAALRGYAADADRAVPRVRAAWGSAGWPGTVVVEAPKTLDQLGALLDAKPGDYRDIAAITTGELGGSASAPADRVLVNPAAFGRLSAFGRQVVLTHETTHVATRLATTAHTPVWLAEGFADWAAYRRSGRTAPEIAPELAADVRAGRPPAALPSDADFGPTAPRLAQAYEGGWLGCRLIADEWSPATLRAVYRDAGAGAGLDSVLRARLGLSAADFTARWRAYVGKELG